jgi:hypothetical protein
MILRDLLEVSNKDNTIYIKSKSEDKIVATKIGGKKYNDEYEWIDNRYLYYKVRDVAGQEDRHGGGLYIVID